MMAADCMVIPRARSAGRKSVTVDPSSTSTLEISLSPRVKKDYAEIQRKHGTSAEKGILESGYLSGKHLVQMFRRIQSMERKVAGVAIRKTYRIVIIPPILRV